MPVSSLLSPPPHAVSAALIIRILVIQILHRLTALHLDPPRSRIIAVSCEFFSHVSSASQSCGCEKIIPGVAATSTPRAAYLRRMRTTMRSKLPQACGLTSVALAALLTGCGGSGEGLDENGRPVTGEETPLVPQLQSIQTHVFTPVCTVCHAAPVLLWASGSTKRLRSACWSIRPASKCLPSNESCRAIRIRSYLIQKLEGHAAVGAQMPLGQPPLPQATINVIRQWIADGAQRGAAPASATSAALQLQATTPLDGEVMSQAPREILVQASGELDTTTLDASTVALRRSGGDGTFGDGNESVVAGVTVSLHSLDPTVLAISIPSGQWVARCLRAVPRRQRDAGGDGPQRPAHRRRESRHRRQRLHSSVHRWGHIVRSRLAPLFVALLSLGWVGLAEAEPYSPCRPASNAWRVM